MEACFCVTDVCESAVLKFEWGQHLCNTVAGWWRFFPSHSSIKKSVNLQQNVISWICFFYYPSIMFYLKYIFHFKTFSFPLKRWAGSHCLRELQPQEEFYSYQEFLSLMMLWTSPAHETHPRRAIHGGQEDKWIEGEQSECPPAYISIGGRLHVICSSV